MTSAPAAPPAAKAVEIAQPPNSDDKETCGVFADNDPNTLTHVDLVVKNSDDNVACIKARFGLMIKLEEVHTLRPRMAPPGAKTDPSPASANDTVRLILGYLPLEHVLSVEESCPSKKSEEKEAEAGSKDDVEKEKDEVVPADKDELEMIVTFTCAKLAFTFKRDTSRIFVSSIRGIVKLDDTKMQEFSAVGPIFVTSDLDHHFKYDDLIEVPSEANSNYYMLTANFYFTEIEAFRKTTTRDFLQPPDEKSKPFSDEPHDLPKRPPLNDTPTKLDTQASIPSSPSEVEAQ